MEITKLHTILAIIVSLIVILGVVFGWFLKPLNKIRTTQELDRLDSQVFQQEQQIRQYKNLAIFERRAEPMRPNEKEIIAEEEKRLDNLKELRDKKYEQAK